MGITVNKEGLQQDFFFLLEVSTNAHNKRSLDYPFRTHLRTMKTYSNEPHYAQGYERTNGEMEPFSFLSLGCVSAGEQKKILISERRKEWERGTIWTEIFDCRASGIELWNGLSSS